MEFSFDRSNESHLRSSTQSNGPSSKTQTPPLQRPQASVDADEMDTSTIANERLRKAIEKNRARQAERARQQTQSHVNEQASFFDRPQEKSTHAEERTHATLKSTTVVTRKSAARPNEAEFTPVKRAPRKVAAQISYSTSSRKKSKPLDPVLVGYLFKGCWIFCALMVLRLIFANGGVTDFYSQRSLHNDRLEELGSIKKENMALVREIERMQTDASFQKKLVRDNLGFIASDEFLVLFPKEK